MNDDRVLIELAVQIGFRAAPRVRYPEGEERLTSRRRHVHTSGIDSNIVRNLQEEILHLVIIIVYYLANISLDTRCRDFQ